MGTLHFCLLFLLFLTIIVTLISEVWSHDDEIYSANIDSKYIMSMSPNYTERNYEIFQTLKKNISIEVFKSAISSDENDGKEQELFFSTEMMDFSGTAYICDLNSPDTREDEESEEPLVDAFEFLAGVCTTITEGWWSYTWCHRQQVMQFHKDPSTGKVDPNWVLGVYEYTESPVINEGKEWDIEEDEKSQVDPTKVVDYFTNGQWCDETQAPRSLNTVYKCCSFPTKKKLRPEQKLVFSIKENSICNYTATVCSPAFCMTKGAGENSAMDLLGELQNSCIHRHEGWWSYEFCFQKSIRQYHLETVTHRTKSSGEEKQVTQMQAEYILGRLTSAQRKKITDDDSIILMPEGSTVPGIFQLEFEGGTLCGLTSQKRSTTVQLKCGPEEKILSIVEDHTCHYVMVVSTTVLCRHFLLGESQKPSTTVFCKKDENHAQIVADEKIK
mmetsp:Transcript_18304/g.24145  ORF Transcript_18304/g.24145 Transcript_18304/m.24145 type:complete len:443 (+) Transcript_18304:126-1454(+)